MSLDLFDLKQKVAIVTGSSRGLGKVFALGLARAGASVVTCSRSLPRAEVTAREIRERGGQALAVKVDTTVRSQCRSMVAAAVEHFGRLDVMVCNAGISLFNPAEAVTESEWQRTIDANLTGYFHCAQLAARQMIAQKHGGSIVMISSNASIVGFANLMAYCAAKGGVDQLVRSMAVEWGRHNIRVNAINPGYTDNVMADGSLGSEAEQTEVCRLTPLGRYGRRQELLGPVIFLASEASSFVTGTILPVDGGWCAQ